MKAGLCLILLFSASLSCMATTPIARTSANSPNADAVTKTKDILLRYQQLMFDDAKFRTAFSRGQKTVPQFQTYLGSYFIPKNLALIKGADGILKTTTAPKVREILLKYRQDMVREDSVARTRLAQLKLPQTKKPQPPEEAQRLLKAVYTFQDNFTPAFQGYMQKRLTRAQAEPVFKKLISQFASTKIYLERRRIQIGKNPDYMKMIDNEIKIVDLLTTGLQATVRYTASKDRKELDLASKNIKSAGLILENLQYPVLSAGNRSTASVGR